MDVGNPSNFVRILEIFNHKFPELKKKLSSYSITDDETLATIKDVFQQYHYVCDPHGAVGYLSLKKYLEIDLDTKGIFLETAHRVKFPDAIQSVIGKKIEIPELVEKLMKAPKKSIVMKAEYDQLKAFLLSSN